MPTGKIISISPSLKNGQHESFAGKPGTPTANKTFYVFLANIEGYGECRFNSTFNTSKWTPGMTVLFDETRIDRDGNKNIKITAEATASGERKGSSYNDPTNNKRMALGMAHNMAVATVKNLEEKLIPVPYKIDNEDPEEALKQSIKNLFSIGRKYYMWITKDETLDERDILSRRWYAIQYGIDCIRLEHIFPADKAAGATDRVIKIAEMQFEDTMKIVAK